ncbi:hypothetical protein HPP92_027034 [Vanilla planifolia]|uniref:Uncharacterized protein n=1 Tax=Vanilla planifolia TaxID=51239 RepID=A0A835PH15_VANPL|nr:hypothetical protein HPP92_027034 [Vanilla planifolia]
MKNNSFLLLILLYHIKLYKIDLIFFLFYFFFILSFIVSIVSSSFPQFAPSITFGELRILQIYFSLYKSTIKSNQTSKIIEAFIEREEKYYTLHKHKSSLIKPQL